MPGKKRKGSKKGGPGSRLGGYTGDMANRRTNTGTNTASRSGLMNLGSPGFIFNREKRKNNKKKKP